MVFLVRIYRLWAIIVLKLAFHRPFSISFPRQQHHIQHSNRFNIEATLVHLSDILAMRSPAAAALPATDNQPPELSANPLLEFSTDPNSLHSNSSNTNTKRSSTVSNQLIHDHSHDHHAPHHDFPPHIPAIGGLKPRGKPSIKEQFPFLDPTEFSFNCIFPECESKFKLTNDLYDHIRSHSKILKCPVCKRNYKCMASLVYHVRTHSGHKPYLCPLPMCKFVTATKGNLKAHLLSNQHKFSRHMFSVKNSLYCTHSALSSSPCTHSALYRGIDAGTQCR